MNIKKSVIIISIFILSICMLLVGVFSYSNNIFKLKANVNDSQSSATFLPGGHFNAKIKSLAANENVTYMTMDSNITSIQKANSVPSSWIVNNEITPPSNNNVLSTEDSANPIYAWYDNGTIYYYSVANNLYMNSTSSFMFYDLLNVTSIDIDIINTSNVTSMNGMFNNCKSLISLDLRNFDTSNVVNMNYMFAKCNSLTSLNVSSFDTSNVTDMGNMFYDCSSLTSLNLSNFNTSKVINMIGMFDWCSKLQTLNLSNFNTSNVTSMNDMFYNCFSLTSLIVNNFDTGKVQSMKSMFWKCSSLTSLDLSSFDTSNVTNMSGMFTGCRLLTTLDLSSFNTSNVTSMEYMFWGCTDLKSIYTSNNFITTNVINSNEMFINSTKLVGGAGTTYNENKVDKEYARVDGGTSNPGYFTLKTANNNENNNQNTNNNETNTNTNSNSNTSSATTNTICELILKSSVYTIDNDKLEINNVNKDHDMDKIKSNLTSDCGVISISFDKIVLSNDKTSKTYTINRVWFPQTGVKVIKYGLIITIIAVIVVGLFILKKKMK